MGWIGCVRCEKFRCDFKARTCALIASVQPVLYWGSCSNETIQNTSKHEFRANWVDWVHSLRKILMRLRGTNFYINCTSSTRFAPSFVLYQNIAKCTKHYELHQNMSLGFNGVDGVSYCEKFWCNFVERTFALIAPVQPVFMELRAETKLSKMHPNTTRRNKTWV